MVWSIFRKKKEIPRTWEFNKVDNCPVIDSFVNQIREKLYASFPHGKFEYDDGFVEFIIERGSAIYRFRFRIRKWSNQAIDIESLSLRIAFDELEVDKNEILSYENRYYRIIFRLEALLEYMELDNYKFHGFETQKENDFVVLFNDLGFVWQYGCIKIIEQFDSVGAVLKFCEKMKAGNTCYGLSDNRGLGYLHCQCLMILKLNWQDVFLSYENVMSTEQYEELRSGLNELILRYQ